MENELVVGKAVGPNVGTALLRVPQKQPLPQVWKKPHLGARAGRAGQLVLQGMKNCCTGEGAKVGVLDGRGEGLSVGGAKLGLRVGVDVVGSTVGGLDLGLLVGLVDGEAFEPELELELELELEPPLLVGEEDWPKALEEVGALLRGPRFVGTGAGTDPPLLPPPAEEVVGATERLRGVVGVLPLLPLLPPEAMGAAERRGSVGVAPPLLLD